MVRQLAGFLRKPTLLNELVYVWNELDFDAYGHHMLIFMTRIWTLLSCCSVTPIVFLSGPH